MNRRKPDEQDDDSLEVDHESENDSPPEISVKVNRRQQTLEFRMPGTTLSLVAFLVLALVVLLLTVVIIAKNLGLLPAAGVVTIWGSFGAVEWVFWRY